MVRFVIKKDAKSLKNLYGNDQIIYVSKLNLLPCSGTKIDVYSYFHNSRFFLINL